MITPKSKANKTGLRPISRTHVRSPEISSSVLRSLSFRLFPDITNGSFNCCLVPYIWQCGSFGPFFKVKRHIFGAILQQKHLVKMLVQLRHDYPWKPKEFLPFSFVDGKDRLTSSKLQWHFSNNVYLIIVKKYALVLLKGEKLMKRERFCSRASRNNFFFLRSIASSSSYLSCAGARRHRPITSTQSSPHLHTYSFNLILSSSC